MNIDHPCLGVMIEMSGRFVENPEPGVGQEGASDGDASGLAGRQARTALA
jgi:hypothetical protein